jgi:hypothetical protein
MIKNLISAQGHRGQGNYGAGNVFQDYFASFRRSQGLRAMTIDIGYLLSVGFVAEHDEYVDHVKSMGKSHAKDFEKYQPLTCPLGLKVMNNNDLHGLMAIAMKGSQAHPAQIMIGLPTNEYKDSWYWIQDGKFVSLLNRAQGHQSGAGTSISLSDELMKATDFMTAVDIICGSMVDKLAKLMMVPASDIDPGKPLSTYGVDSLVAVEVRNWMAKEILVEVSVFEIMANVPMRQLAVDLAGKSRVLEQLRADGTS